MLTEKPETVQDFAPVNWEGIRAEYYKVWADFPLIAHPFGIRLSQHQLNALGHMLVAMDLIDSAVDRESNQSVRLELGGSILNWMKGDVDPFPLTDRLDPARIQPLREILAERQLAVPFLAAASNVFLASEGKRNSATVSDMVRNLIGEGQSAAEMTIQILGRNTNQSFNEFLQRVMRIGTIVDTLLDANDDFEKGILQLVPNRFFHWRLKFAIARQLPGLILAFPDRRLLWRYCLSYTRDGVKPLVSTERVSENTGKS